MHDGNASRVVTMHQQKCVSVNLQLQGEILTLLEKYFTGKIIFPDEANFTRDGFINFHNSCIRFDKNLHAIVLDNSFL